MFHFGQYKIDVREVFFTSPLSYALVNQKPILPGHILVCPQRVVQRLRDLTSAEVSDLFQTVQKLSGVVERAYKGEAVTISLQDGPAAGQTVRHVHVHVIPRHSGDFERNDDIYPKLEEASQQLDKDMAQRNNQLMAVDSDRVARSLDDMAKEARWLSQLIQQEQVEKEKE